GSTCRNRVKGRVQAFDSPAKMAFAGAGDLASRWDMRRGHLAACGGVDGCDMKAAQKPEVG
ncbi:MAG: hypothetical protein WA638_07220, partial [Candidatus Acidiferrales bacterium]